MQFYADPVWVLICIQTSARTPQCGVWLPQAAAPGEARVLEKAALQQQVHSMGTQTPSAQRMQVTMQQIKCITCT